MRVIKATDEIKAVARTIREHNDTTPRGWSRTDVSAANRLHGWTLPAASYNGTPWPARHVVLDEAELGLAWKLANDLGFAALAKEDA